MYIIKMTMKNEKQMGITVRAALNQALRESLAEDSKVLLLGEEVAQYNGPFKISEGLLKEFGPDRVVDTPITEMGFAGLGVGLAFQGYKPIVEFMTMNFSMQAIDQIVNSAAKTNYMSGGQMGCPIVFRGPNGSALQNAAQHSQSFGAWFAHVPGLKVISPYGAAESYGLLRAAIADPNPVVFLEHEMLYGQIFDEELPTTPLEIGKSEIMLVGQDVTIVSFSIGLHHTMQALPRLRDMNISPEIINLRTLRPLDIAPIIKSIQKTNRLVVVEEGWPFCSISSEIITQVLELAFDYLDAPPVRVTSEDVPLPYALNLEKLALPSADKVVLAVQSVLK